MAFYIKPPSGSVPLNKLQNFVMNRLVFLYYIHNHSVEDVFKIIIKESLAKNSECLIEGTSKDKISHFTLRLLCISSSVLEEFFIENETKLFVYRLQFSDISQMQQMFQKACEQSKYILCYNSYIFKYYEQILRLFISVAEELDFTIKNNKSVIKVPFTAALKFVKERSYPLQFGYIRLPLSDLKSLCKCIFEESLIQGINQVKKTQSKNFQDSRMLHISQKIVKWIHSKLLPERIPSKKLTKACNLPTASKKFPLCMKNLHNLLLKHHRLKHVSRIQFTLFLKEIGVSADDVIKLFKKEYSIPFVATYEHKHTSCSHNWIKNQNKFIYSIEHLYGKRGARKNYRAHNCLSLQNSYDSEGGCPFVSFDSQHLQNALQNENLEVEDIEDIASLVQENKYQEACCFYLRCKINIQKNVLCNIDTAEETSACASSSVCHNLKNNENNIKDPLLPSSLLSIKKPSDFYSILSSNFDE